MSNRYFYFTRHGQTIWNVENKICGATDIALTDLGHQQASRTLENMNPHQETVMSSVKIRRILSADMKAANPCCSFARGSTIFSTT